MDQSIQSGLKKVFSGNQGLVLGGNDFFYTHHLTRHPCVEFLYLYGWYLKELGVDTIFVENHYISEPIQTRGFLGQLMYCCYLFDFRVVGLEFKGSMREYLQYTGKEVSAKVTTIAYNESERLLRLNRVVKDIVEYHQRGKWILFCGMSHVGDTDKCEGIKTLLNVPGWGIQEAKSNSIRPKADFVDGRYRKPTDCLVQLAPPEKYSERLYIDSLVFSVMYGLLYFFSGYRKVKKVETVGELFKQQPTVYPLWYNDMIDWIVKTDPVRSVPDPEVVCTLAFDLTREVCSREMVASIKTGLTEKDLEGVVDTILLFVEKDYHSVRGLMDMVFLEKKTLPLSNNPREMISQIKTKFKKQLHRSENHLYVLFQILFRLKLPLPDTHAIRRLFSN